MQNTNNELVSVIVPVYKVEPYLDRCVASILAQTYPNLEVILVDDGSPDNCPALCDAWAQRDARIRVIHKKNGGQSDARNVGLDAASGAYISFVDSDDYIEKNMYEVLEERMRINEADISCCGRYVVQESDGTKMPYFILDREQILSPCQAIGKLLIWDGCDSAAWDKLYKVKLFKGRRYPFGVLHEDLNFTSKLFSESNKIVLTGMPLYNYLIRENSICNKPFTTQKFDIYEQAKLNCQFVRDTYKELEEKAKYFLFRCTCTLLQSASDAAQISEKDLKRVKELARTQLSTAILNRFVPLGERKYYFELLYKVCIKKK